jgi:hydroxymethylglutaryl-CoA reductase
MAVDFSREFAEFRRKTPEERLAIVKASAALTEEEAGLLRREGALDLATANRMIENVVGEMQLPLGIATDFVINGRSYLVPYALEEPSVVAGASYAAKLALPEGFQASSDEPVMIGQVQLLGTRDPEAARKDVLAKKMEIVEFANKQDPTLVKLGGGVRDLEARVLESPRGRMLVVHLLVDVRDAMGANAVNTMCEAIAPKLEEITGGKVRLRIISNLATKRLARAKAVWKKEALEESVRKHGLDTKGEEVVEAILDAWAFAAVDPYRAATNNKGIMNGIDAVVVATGNDFRAVEAGAHAYASLSGRYLPLTKYEKDRDGNLVGSIELPIAVGLVGGATKTHPIARIAVKILGVKTAQELAQVLAAVGLAQNFAALRALATEGIQRGHMRLHARNIAVLAGATGDLADEVAEQMVKEKAVRVDRAKEILEERKSRKS